MPGPIDMTDRLLSPLLELDPELGQLLGGERLDTARRELQVAVHALQPGVWDAGRLSGASPDNVGLLVLDGVLAREVLVTDTVSTELLGPGDIVRPWRLHDGASLLQHGVRWNVLSLSRVALLDRRFGVQLARYPEINAAVLDRVNERTLRLAVTQAISQLNRVDRRLLALLWHLAERWGRMTPDGVAVPMTLSHRMLGQLIGARRPTVSTALSDLIKHGQLMRRDDSTWLLIGEPVGVPAAQVARVIPMRRQLLRPEPPPAKQPPPEPVRIGDPEIRADLARLREQCSAHVARLEASYARTSSLAEQTIELRDICRSTRAGVRAARQRAQEPSGV